MEPTSTIQGGESMVKAEDLIMKEMEIVQSEIGRFDGNGLKIKEWTLAVWAALLAYGVQHEQPVVVAASIVSTVCFGLVEISYRRIQLRFIYRSSEIEGILKGKELDNYNWEINRCAAGLARDCSIRSEVPQILKYPHITLFYTILISFSIASLIYVIIT